MFYACVTRFDVTENLKKNSFLGELNKTLFESFQSFMEINSESPSASMRAQMLRSKFAVCLVILAQAPRKRARPSELIILAQLGLV